MQSLNPRTAIRTFHDALVDPKNIPKLALFAVVWVALCVGDGFWMYYYVHGAIYPLPRNALNRNESAWSAFTAFMFIFGFCLGIFNAILSLIYLIVVWPKRKQRLSWAAHRFRVYLLWLSLPFLLSLTIMPFFGGWIVVPIVAQHVWSHGCDSYPAFAILDAKSSTDSSSVLNHIYFYMNQPSARSPTQLFTLTLTTPDSDTNWLLNLIAWNTPQASIPLDFYPTLQAVRYNLTASTLAGNCTLRTSADTPGTTTAPCMSGTFDSGPHLAFTISSSVPPNSTLASQASTPNTTTHLAIPDVGWAFGQPAVRLEVAQPDGGLGALVLATTVTRPHDATELKVCVAGPPGRPAAAVQPEVLAPLGLILMRQINYAAYVTQPPTTS